MQFLNDLKKDNLLQVIDTIKDIAHKENDIIKQDTLFQCVKNLKGIYRHIEDMEFIKEQEEAQVWIDLEAGIFEFKDVEKNKPLRKMVIGSK